MKSSHSWSLGYHLGSYFIFVYVRWWFCYCSVISSTVHSWLGWENQEESVMTLLGTSQEIEREWRAFAASSTHFRSLIGYYAVTWDTSEWDLINQQHQFLQNHAMVILIWLRRKALVRLTHKLSFLCCHPRLPRVPSPQVLHNGNPTTTQGLGHGRTIVEKRYTVTSGYMTASSYAALSPLSYKYATNIISL